MTIKLKFYFNTSQCIKPNIIKILRLVPYNSTKSNHNSTSNTLQFSSPATIDHIAANKMFYNSYPRDDTTFFPKVLSTSDLGNS